MALLSLGESRWRMLRRVIKKKKFKYDDVRNQTRLDQKHFYWMVDNGFVTRVGEDTYELTEKGRASAELGEYEWEPPAKATTTPTVRPKKGK